MKNVYLFIALAFVTLSACQKEEVKPSNLRMSNEGIIRIESNTPFAFSVFYFSPEGRVGDLMIKDTIVGAGKHEFNFNVNKTIDFGYGLQKRDYQDKSEVTATLSFGGFSNTKKISDNSVLIDKYEFSK